MADTPTPPNPAPAVKAKAKGLTGKLKGLPPWAYVAAIGVGGITVWWAISRSRQNAADTAATDTGTAPDPSASAYETTPYPSGGGGGSYFSDPTTGASQSDSFTTFLAGLAALQEAGLIPTGGGTQSSASPDDHYTPPQITVNVPPSAVPSPPPQPAAPAKPAAKAPDPCTGQYPFLQTSGPNKGKCYRVDLKNGKRYNNYKGGPNWVPA